MIFILDHSICSTLGLCIKEKEQYKDRYKYDFLKYHSKELDWFAFLFILFATNLNLIIISDARDIEQLELKVGQDMQPLKKIMYLLQLIHFVQLIFLRKFYDSQMKVNTNYW
jgi:hypothetical protein